MLHDLKVRILAGMAAGLLATVAYVAPASAQSGEPIKIGLSMSLTGPLAANGKQALLGAKIWEEEINGKGGLLGRPVKLVFYDDQSNPSQVPGIYTKLLDVDKVDLVVSSYATNMIAPAMPIVMQKNKTFISLFGLDVNAEFKYPKYFSVLPTGPETKESFTEGFYEVALKQDPKPTTVALAAEDAEFSRNACEGARENAAKVGLLGPQSARDVAYVYENIRAFRQNFHMLSKDHRNMPKEWAPAMIVGCLAAIQRAETRGRPLIETLKSHAAEEYRNRPETRDQVRFALKFGAAAVFVLFVLSRIFG